MRLQDYTDDVNSYKKQVELATALHRLVSNRDFMLVFTQYYQTEYVLSLVGKLSQYSNDSDEGKEILNELSVISHFQKFIDNVIVNGAMAEDALHELLAIPEEELDYE